MTAPNNDDKVERLDISALKDTLGPVMADPIIIDRLSALGCELVVYPDHDITTRIARFSRRRNHTTQIQIPLATTLFGRLRGTIANDGRAHLDALCRGETVVA